MDRQQITVMAMGAAHRAHKQFGVDPRSRVDVFGVLRSANAYVFFRPLRSMFGAYLPTKGEMPGLLINSNLPLSVQRYTAAHEFGHVYMKHKTVSLDSEISFVPEERSGVDQDEIAAEAFAAFFLMPKPLVVNSMRDLALRPEQINPSTAYLLALRMGTSYRATVNHLQTLKFVTRSLAAKLRDIKPQDIKQDLNEDEKVGKRDVWVLDELSNGKPIFPAPQDMIRIQLQEVPTSGYTWLVSEKPEGVQVLEDTYREDSSDGIGGSCVHEFVARLEDDAKHSKLVLQKRRVWEEEGQSLGNFAVEVLPQEFRRTGPLVLPRLARLPA
jgi:Zn-dependent peptidase ImmA (M78 family)